MFILNINSQFHSIFMEVIKRIKELKWIIFMFRVNIIKQEQYSVNLLILLKDTKSKPILMVQTGSVMLPEPHKMLLLSPSPIHFMYIF